MNHLPDAAANCNINAIRGTHPIAADSTPKPDLWYSSAGFEPVHKIKVRVLQGSVGCVACFLQWIP